MQKPLRILILEDQPADAELMILQLEQADLDFQWQRVEDEAAFLDALEPSPDLILADYTLPRYGAMKALAEIRKRNLDIPFLVVSGTLDEATALATIDAGAVDYVFKNQLERLGFAVERALAEQRFRERHRATQRRLRQEIEKFREFVEMTDDLVTQVDAEGKFLYVNPRSEKFLGLTPRECVGRSAFDLVHPDDRQRTKEAFAGWVRSGAPHAHFENRIVNRTGEVFHVSWTISLHFDDEGRVVYLFSTARDVTGLRESQRRIGEKTSLLEATLESLEEGVLVVGPKDRTIIAANRGVEKIFGYSRDEVIGRNTLFLHPDRKAFLDWRRISEPVLEQGGSFQRPWQLRRSNGEIFWAEVTVTAIDPELGWHEGVVSVVRDVSQEKAATDALRERVKEQQCLFAITDLVNDPDLDRGEILQRAANLLPAGFQVPETACARITVDGEIWVSEDFAVTPWRLAAPIVSTESSRGEIEVFYREKRPAAEERFLQEERRLLHGVAERIGSFLQRRETTAALRAIRLRLQHLLSVTPGLIFSADPEPPFRATFMSENVRNLTGYDPEAFLENPDFWLGKIHPEDRPGVEEFLQGLTPGREDSFEYRFLCSEGEWRWMLESIRLLTDGSGHPIEFVGSVVDITELKQTQDRLQAALETQRSMIEASPAAIFTVGLDGRILTWNTSAEKIFGWSAEETVGRPAPFVPADFQEEFHRHLEQILEGGKIVEKEVYRRTKNGRIIPISLSAAPIRDARGDVQAVMAIIFDISRRKHIENQLRRSEEQNRLFFESPAVGTALVGPDMKFLRVNDTYCRMTGYSREELLGMGPVDLSHPDDWQRDLETYQAYFQKGQEVFRTEKRYLRKDGSRIWVQVSAALLRKDDGKPLYSAGIIQDVTPRKLAEEALRTNEQRLKKAQEIARLGSWEYLPAENVLIWSDETFRIFGMEPDEFSGTIEAFLEAIHPDDRQAVNDAYQASVKENQPGYEIEHRIVQKQTGDIRFVREKCEHLRDEAGTHLRSVGMIHDITERKQAELDLLRANRTLRVVSLCNEALVRAVSEQELMQKILTQMVETGGYPVALTWLSGEEEGDFQLVVYPEKAAGLLTGSEQRSCGIVRHLARVCRQPFSREVPLTDEVLSSDSCCRELTEVFDLRSAFSLALDVQGEHLGCLVLFSSAEGFHSEEIYLLKELADDLAYGIRSLRTQAAHREAQELLRLRNRAIEASVNGIMISEDRFPELPLIYVNKAFERITGYAAEEVLGRDPRFLAGQDHEQKALADIRAALRAGRPETVLVRNYRKDGSRFWNDLSVAPVRNEAGEVTHFVSILNDVTERMAYEEELAKKSNYDELTGLANRNLLHDRIEQAIAHARRTGETLALCLLDLDRFQVINDSLGHSLGNELLKRVAERLAAVVRAQDTLARLGGDEFVVLFQDVQDHEGLGLLAEKLHTALAPPFAIGNRQLTITASIGVSLFPNDGESGDVLIRNADLAMYQSKEEGRDTFRYFTPELDVRVVETMDLEADLRRALERSELLLHFQPKVEVASGRIVGCEALVRWQHPERGMVSPGAFIPLAEETGLIEPLGAWVLREACRTSRAFQERGLPPLPVAVNISARQFRNERLVEMIGEILEECGLEARWLELELTESMVMEKPEQAAETMFRLKQLGLGLSLDDFGTGYSSLNYLRRFPVDRLKIDRTFISEVAADPGAAAVAESVVAIAHNLGIGAVAEGVETEEQLAFLRGCGCDLYQGFFFSRPAPAEEYAELLKSERGKKS